MVEEAVTEQRALPKIEEREFPKLPEGSRDEKTPAPFVKREIPPIGSSVIHTDRSGVYIDATKSEKQTEVPEDVRAQIAEAAKAFADTSIEESGIFSHASNFRNPGERKIFFSELAKLKASVLFRNSSGAGAMNSSLLSEQEANIRNYFEISYETWSKASGMRNRILNPIENAS